MSNKKEPTPQEIIQRITKLNDDSTPRERRAFLANALVNLALIPEADFIASEVKRADTLLAVYEEFLVWN